MKHKKKLLLIPFILFIFWKSYSDNSESINDFRNEIFGDEENENSAGDTSLFTCEACEPVCESIIDFSSDTGTEIICSSLLAEFPGINLIACSLLSDIVVNLSKEVDGACEWTCSRILDCDDDYTIPTSERRRPAALNTLSVSATISASSGANVREQPFLPERNRNQGVIGALPYNHNVEIIAETCSEDGYRWAMIDYQRPRSSSEQQGWIVRYLLAPNISERERCCGDFEYIDGTGCIR